MAAVGLHGLQHHGDGDVVRHQVPPVDVRLSGVNKMRGEVDALRQIVLEKEDEYLEKIDDVCIIDVVAQYVFGRFGVRRVSERASE